MGAESADFFFDCWYLKVITDDGIWYVPGGIRYRKRFKISMFELDVVPQSWMPYVQMGLKLRILLKDIQSTIGGSILLSPNKEELSTPTTAPRVSRQFMVTGVRTIALHTGNDNAWNIEQLVLAF
jgi:hypothetical protein